VHAARPEGKSGGDPPCVGDAARRDDRCPHGVCDLRHQGHCADHAGSGAVAKAAAVTAGFEPLRDDDVGTVCLKRAGLGDGGRRAQDDAARFLDPSDSRSGRRAEVKADDARPKLQR